MLQNRKTVIVFSIVFSLLMAVVTVQAEPITVGTLDNRYDTMISEVTGQTTQTQNSVIGVTSEESVEGTVCDCGEIQKGGVPKWPLLFLAAVPAFFLLHGHDTDVPTTFVTVTTVPTSPHAPSVPEPATLLLFGTGLAAFAGAFRRRHKKSVTANLSLEISKREE